MTSGGGIVTRLTEENAWTHRISGLQIKPGSHLAVQAICHNAALIGTEATADPALGRPGILQFAQSISNLMASINKAQIESRAWGRIASTVRPRAPVSNTAFFPRSAINTLTDCP